MLGWRLLGLGCCQDLSLHVRIPTIVNFLQEDAEVTKAFEEDIETPPTRNIPSPGQLDPDTRIPVINLEDGTRLVGEEAPKNKDLVEWLKLHPAYTVDMPSYVPVSITECRVGRILPQSVHFLLPCDGEAPGPAAFHWTVSSSGAFPSFCHCIFYIRETSFRPVVREGQPCTYLKMPSVHFLALSFSHQIDVGFFLLLFAWRGSQGGLVIGKTLPNVL